MLVLNLVIVSTKSNPALKFSPSGRWDGLKGPRSNNFLDLICSGNSSDGESFTAHLLVCSAAARPRCASTPYRVSNPATK